MSRDRVLHVAVVILTAILLFGVVAGNLAAEVPVPGEPPLRPDADGTDKRIKEPQAVASTTLLPLVVAPPAPAPWVDTQNRESVRQFFLSEYLASQGIDDGWTGSQASCDPGTTSAAFTDAILRRINYFRAMSGVPPIVAFKSEYSQKAQSAALMMSANDQLDHTPPERWRCYTAGGYEGAGSSNLFLGVYGPAAISGYVRDPGDGNYFVGHRRWILYPQTQYMGSGDVPAQDGYRPANALWVFDRDNMWEARPATREPYVAWPPPGYVPVQVVYPRWSFAYPHADFSGTTVSVSRNGQAVAVTVSPVENGFGENTLVWELGEPVPNEETVYTVVLENVMADGVARRFDYQVTIFDPEEGG